MCSKTDCENSTDATVTPARSRNVVSILVQATHSRMVRDRASCCMVQRPKAPLSPLRLVESAYVCKTSRTHTTRCITVSTVSPLLSSQGFRNTDNSLVIPCIAFPVLNAPDICSHALQDDWGAEPEGRAAHLREVPTVQQAGQTRSAKSLLRS